MHLVKIAKSRVKDHRRHSIDYQQEQYVNAIEIDELYPDYECLDSDDCYDTSGEKPSDKGTVKRENDPGDIPAVCSCNGTADFVKQGGSCTEASKGSWWCYVNENTCKDQRSHNGRFISFSACSGSDCIEEKTAYHSNNVVFGWDNIRNTTSDCSKSCRNNQQCKFWSYATFNGWCFLKSKRENIRNWETYTSGSRDCNVS